MDSEPKAAAAVLQKCDLRAGRRWICNCPLGVINLDSAGATDIGVACGLDGGGHQDYEATKYQTHCLYKSFHRAFLLSAGTGVLAIAMRRYELLFT